MNKLFRLKPGLHDSCFGTVRLNFGPHTQNILERYASFLLCECKRHWLADQKI